MNMDADDIIEKLMDRWEKAILDARQDRERVLALREENEKLRRQVAALEADDADIE